MKAMKSEDDQKPEAAGRRAHAAWCVLGTNIYLHSKCKRTCQEKEEK